MNQDPILAALARIEAKQDLCLANQEIMEEELQQIRAETRRISAATGAAAGGVAGALSGGMAAAGIALIKAKLGL
ncbi:hypothetical protein [Neisseria leonii]|uniref:hypothetical protein n=1 Tax=Neisseria leonii TaxID=2995413 RepID=UPI00237AB52B|nr:hypothetical protein [Neisseria sp. 3986]MDD9325626.1 hypothetical protein [Neisseria sp. 3986]